MHLSSFFSLSTLPSAVFSALVFATLVEAQDRSTEQEEAQISDPNLECTPYYYPPVGDAKSNFPRTWTLATLVPGDTEAQSKFQSIQGQIPNIAPKGQQPQSLIGNWTGFTYDPTDPDCWWTWQKCTTPKVPGLPADIAMLPEPNTLGFGFDDGPNCSHNAFYDYLQSKDQKATMFYVGSNVLDWPLEAQRGLADGHQICVHTWSHRYMTALTNDEAFAELWYIINFVIGVTPTCWRPPYGDVDDRIRFIANALGLSTIMWQYDSNDWRVNTNATTPANVDNNYLDLIAAAQNGTFSTYGTMMLTHELNNFTMSEAVKFYDQLAAVFAHLVPIGVALNISDPYFEDGYTLPSFEEYIGGTHVGSVTGSSDNNDGPFDSPPNGPSGSLFGGTSNSSSLAGSSGSTGGTSPSTLSNQSGASKIAPDKVGVFAGAAIIVGGIMSML